MVGRAMIYPPLDHWLWLLPAFALGGCIGSFLNVVIYRLPRGLSVNRPRRSFCPGCKAEIPMWLNIPIASWLWLRGKCASCREPIAARYPMVELLTALLFVAAWWVFPPQAALLMWAFLALCVAISYIDAEHMVIPSSLTWTGSALGLVAAAVWHRFPEMGGELLEHEEPLFRALRLSTIGWVAGFFGILLVVELGKLAFGKRQMRYEEPVEWMLREPAGDEDPMCFVIDGEEIAWWDLFNRKRDVLRVEATDIRVDGKSVGGGLLEIREREITLPDGTVHPLAKLESLEGRARSAVAPREAMGVGDAHLMGMVGAFFGAPAVLFAVFAGAFFALFAALVARIGFGRPLPFGPFLVLGALTWAFGGWKLWGMYWEWVNPLGLT